MNHTGWIKKWEPRALITFEILFLITGFLQNCTLTFGKPVISFVQWPAVALGAILILIRLIHIREYLSTRGILLLALFALSFAVSMILNREFGWYENFRMLVFMGFQFALLYAYPSGEAPERRQKHFEILAWIYVACALIITVTGFCFLFAGYSKVIIPESGPTMCLGFCWGRLFGAWWDPNIGAVASVVAADFAVYFFCKYRSVILRIFLGLGIVIQCFGVAFSDSRSGQVALAVSLLVGTGMLAIRKIGFSSFLKGALSIALALLMGIAGLFLPRALKAAGNAGMEFAHEMGFHSFTQEGGDEALAIGRAGDLEGNITNRRTDIWKSAVEIFRTRPVFGVSRNAILDYARKNLPDTYIINNDHMDFDSMHNILFDILVSQGAVGIVLFLLFGVWWLIGLIAGWRRIVRAKNYRYLSLCLVAVFVTLVTSMVMTEIVYVISPTATIAWLSLGALSQNVKKEESK